MPVIEPELPHVLIRNEGAEDVEKRLAHMLRGEHVPVHRPVPESP